MYAILAIYSVIFGIAIGMILISRNLLRKQIMFTKMNVYLHSVVVNHLGELRVHFSNRIQQLMVVGSDKPGCNWHFRTMLDRLFSRITSFEREFAHERKL